MQGDRLITEHRRTGFPFFFVANRHPDVRTTEQMRYNDYIKAITRFFNSDFFTSNERLFRNSLRAENCWCPLLAKSTLVDITSVKRTVREYYGGLSFLSTALIEGKPLITVKCLERIRSHFQPYGIPLSDLLNGENLFETGCYYYSPATEPEFEEEKSMHFGIYFPGSLDDIFHDNVPEVFQSFTMIDLTKAVLDCLSPFADTDSIEKMMKSKWDEIDLSALKSYVGFKLCNIPSGSEKTNTHQENYNWSVNKRLDEIADLLGITERTLRRILNGETRPNLKEVFNKHIKPDLQHRTKYKYSPQAIHLLQNAY